MKKQLKYIFECVIFGIIIGIVIYQCMHLFLNGSYSYFFTLDATYDMLIEIVLFGLIIAIINFGVHSSLKWVFSLIVLAIMSYIHQNIFPVIIAIIYVGIIYMCGDFFVTYILRLNKLDITIKRITAFVVGVHFQAFVTVIVSICNIYSRKLVLNICLFISILRAADYIKGAYIGKDNLKNSIKEYSTSFVIMITYIEVVAFIQIARMSLQGDWDGLWYGLRADKVLANTSRGIFENFDLLGVVYLYPKGYEILNLPLTALNSWSYQFSLNLIFSIMLLWIVYHLLLEICNNKNACLITAMIASIPAIASMAVTTKADIITVLFQVAAVYVVIYAYKHSRYEYYYIAIGIFLSTFSYKVTSVLFTPLLMVGCLGFVRWNKIRIKCREMVIAIGGLIYWLAIWSRTQWLTGTPLIVYTGKMLKLLGVDTKYPYEVVENFYGETESIIGLIQKIGDNLWKFFLRPDTEQTGHIIIAWGSAFPLVMFLLAVVAFVIKGCKIKKYFPWCWFSFVQTCALFLGLGFLGSSDGNYIILIYVLYSVLGCAYVFENYRETLGVVGVMLIFNTVYLALSNWSWTVGFSKIDFTNKGYIDQIEIRTDEYVNQNGNKIIDRINEKKGKLICVGPVNMLPLFDCPAELYTDIYHIIGNEEAFEEYVDFCDFKYIYLDKEIVLNDNVVNDTLQKMISSGTVKKIILDNNNALLILNGEKINSEKLINKYNKYMQIDN